MWEYQGESARHNRPSPCGALEPVAAVSATEGSRKVVPDQFAAKTGEMGGRLIKHARYYWLLLAESHLTRRLFGSMLRRMEGLPLPVG